MRKGGMWVFGGNGGTTKRPCGGVASLGSARLLKWWAF